MTTSFWADLHLVDVGVDVRPAPVEAAQVAAIVDAVDGGHR